MRPIELLGRDAVAIALESPFERFSSHCGVDGLARITKDGSAEILAVASKETGKGNFQKFVAECKKCFRRIVVIDIFNQDLKDALVRYGFEDVAWRNDCNEEYEAMQWSLP